jgi:glycosyltransferase involved in cell wall biosynthesis
MGKRLQTIFRQTYPIYEVIILDDASSDNSIEVIKKTLKKYDVKLEEITMNKDEECYEGVRDNIQIKIVINKKNSGKAMAQWKKGFELARGDYLWIAEADDLCSRNFLTEVMNGFDNPEVVLSYSESAIINRWGMMIAPNFRWSRDKEKTGHYKKSYIKDGKIEIREIMAIRCTIPNVSGVVFKNNKKFLKYLEDSLKYTQTGDWFFYVKVLGNGKICYNRKSLNKFRVHSGSRTAESKKAKQHLMEIKEIQGMIERKYSLSDTVKKRMRTEIERVAQRLDDSSLRLG